MLKYNQNMKTPKIKFTIITLFEEAIRPYLETSMMWKAAEKGIAEFDFVNLRDFGLGPHKSVDDTPYGGGDGMLLRCEPVFAAIEMVKAKDPDAKVILPTPAGALWTQDWARRLAMMGGSLAGRTELSAQDKSGSLQSSASEHLAMTGGSLAGRTELCMPSSDNGSVCDGLARNDGPSPERGMQSYCSTGQALYSVMLANNEIGTINDIKKLAKQVHENGALFHTDATQALGKIKIDVKDLNVDYMTISSHKIGGPIGIGTVIMSFGLGPIVQWALVINEKLFFAVTGTESSVYN